MDEKIQMHKVQVIPTMVDKTVDDKTVKAPQYERTSKPSEKAVAAGYKPDKFYHIQLTPQSEHVLGGAGKPHTETIFKTTSPNYFNAIKTEIEEGNVTELKTDHILLLNEKMPGRIVERRTPAYYGTEPTKDGGERIRKVRQKVRVGDDQIEYRAEPMVNNSLRLFLFEPEAMDEDQAEVAFQRAWKRRKLWVVEPNAESEGDNPPAESSSSSEETTAKTEETEKKENTSKEGDEAPE